LKPECAGCPVLANTLFRNLSGDQFARFTCIFRPAHYRRNQILFFEGGAADHLFALSAGLVKMVKPLENGKQRITRVIFPGDLFGLEALNETKYPLSAVVLQDSEICAAPCKDFFTFLRANPDISLDMIRFLLGEIAEIRSRMTTMSFKNAGARVATFLFSLISPDAMETAKSYSLTLSLTSQEIGEVLELSSETVSRAWNLLRREGLIEKRGRRLVIQDVQALERATHH